MKRDKPSNKGVIILVALLMSALPLIYVLSSGPTLVFVKRGELDSGLWQKMYHPVLYVNHKSPGFKKAWMWYLAEWTER